MSKSLEEEIKSIKNIKEIYAPILDGLKSIHFANKRLKDTELGLREKECARQGLYKKDGTTLDVAKIKANAFKSAIDVWDGGVDKINLLKEEKDDYLASIKNGNIDKAEVKSFINQKNSLAEAKKELSYTIEELKVQASPEIIGALKMLAENEINKIKEDEVIKEGKEIKPPKDISVMHKLFSLLKERLSL